MNINIKIYDNNLKRPQKAKVLSIFGQFLLKVTEVFNLFSSMEIKSSYTDLVNDPLIIVFVYRMALILILIFNSCYCSNSLKSRRRSI